MKKHDANLIVIGAGSGGLVTAYIAAAIKAKVFLIEKGEMGGDCLNTGCVPSKSLIASAKYIHDIKHSENFGIRKAECEFDFADIMKRVHSIIDSIRPHDSVERYTSLGVDVIKGEATILSRNKVQVNGATLTAKAIVIAAGAEPLVPPIEGLDETGYFTSDTLWNITELPKKMVVLGGGPIGCELAQCFARFGSQVTLVEMVNRILIREDPEFSNHILKRFATEGIRVLTSHKAVKATNREGSKFLICEGPGKAEEIEFDTLLLALGRAARIDGYGLNQMKIPITPQRRVEVNEYLQAGYSNIYAVGDVTGPYQFTHAAAHQAWYASVNALFSPFKKFKADYSVLPWATYTDPEVARVGLNELEANEKHIPYEVTTYSLAELDRAKADGHAEGWIKVLTVPNKDRILGVTIISKHAGDLIAEFVLAMRHGLGLNKILGTIHSYPTWMEANKFAAGNWKKAHAPEWVLKFLQKYHGWRRAGF